MIKINLHKEFFEDQKTKIRHYYFAPWVTVSITHKHKLGKAIRSYLDTGATINVFPWEYGEVFLGLTLTSRNKTYKQPLLGIGGIKREAFGYECDIQHSDFHIKNSMVYFVDRQTFPLLGNVGFIDKFKRITLNMEDKLLELNK